jgi:cob(I)alamin adenosyltransferase
MSIVTKTGDLGHTSLFSGERVLKSELRVDVYGTIDELSSHLGFAKHYLSPSEKEILESLQGDLVAVAAEIASEKESPARIREGYDPERLEKLVESLEQQLDLSGFVLPGETQAAGALDICRTVARRAERRLIALAQEKPVSDRLRQYLNRLSDLLYLLARHQGMPAAIS